VEVQEASRQQGLASMHHRRVLDSGSEIDSATANRGQGEAHLKPQRSVAATSRGWNPPSEERGMPPSHLAPRAAPTGTQTV